MLSFPDLRDKGVEEVPHDQLDGYYKALLTLSGDKLRQMISDMALEGNTDNSWFIDRIKKAGVAALPEDTSVEVVDQDIFFSFCPDLE